MEEFQVALGIEWRAPIEAIVPLRTGWRGACGVYSVYSEGGPPAIELVQSVPGTPLAGNGGVSFPSPGLLDGRARRELTRPRRTRLGVRSTVASPENSARRFTLQQSPHGFYVELFDTATPRHADLLPKPSGGEGTDDEHH